VDALLGSYFHDAHTIPSTDYEQEESVRIVETVRIERSPDDVWAVVSDLDTHLEWRPALLEFRQISDGPLQVGSRIREVLRWRGRELVLDDFVTALEPGRHFGITGGWKAADFDLDLLLEPSDGGTVVTFDWPLRPKSVLLKVAAPLLKGAMRRATAEEARLLKEYVERPDVAEPPSL
jgi:carbon monoxide dehydrogenase subunit G